MMQAIISHDLIRRNYDEDTIKTLLFGAMRAVHRANSFAEQVDNNFRRYREGYINQSWTERAYAFALAYFKLITPEQPQQIITVRENVIFQFPINNLPLVA